MPDKRKADDEAAAEPVKRAAPVEMTAEQRERVEDPNQIDETVPGGEYIDGDVVRNAHGEVIRNASKAELKVDSSPAPVERAPAVATQNVAVKKD